MNLTIDMFCSLIAMTSKMLSTKSSNDDKRIAIISHDFATIKKLMWAVASSSIGSLVVAFFEFIFK